MITSQPPFLRDRGGAIEVDIIAVPNARKTEIIGPHGDRLKIKVHAPPVDGKANEEICDFFAERLGCSRSAVSILRGETSKQKTLQIRGVDAQLALAAVSKKGKS